MTEEGKKLSPDSNGFSSDKDDDEEERKRTYDLA
jgi:hypothetical protein